LPSDGWFVRGGRPAALGGEPRQRPAASLPPIWSKGTPVDIAGDADGSRYAAALDALIADPASDALLVMNVPTALASAADAAQAVIGAVRQHRQAQVRPKPVFPFRVDTS